MTHDDARELVPVYALDALSEEEGLEMQSHLETCLSCREALEAHRQAAASLALLAEPVRPPDALRARLLQAIGESAAPRALRPAPPARPIPGLRRLRWQSAVAIASAAAVLALGVLSYSLARGLTDRDREIARQRAFVAALSAPLLTTIPMTAQGNLVKASGRIYVAADGRSGGLIASGLSDPGASVYQLWLIVDNQPAPVEAFRPDAHGYALVPIGANLSQLQAMAVTLEQRAGNPAPQGPFVLKTA